MSWETVYWLSQLLLVLFAGVALVSGAVVNKRQSRQLLTLEATLEEQRHKTEGLHQDNIAAQSALEKERTARLEMEKSLAPRSIPFVMINGISNIESLSPFAGMQYQIRHLPDAEPSRAAHSLDALLNISRWKATNKVVSPEFTMGLWDGVTICWVFPGDWDKDRPFREASDALIKFLEANGWSAKRGPWSDPAMPGTLQITIGFKPWLPSAGNEQ